jgi:hypothetical protein
VKKYMRIFGLKCFEISKYIKVTLQTKGIICTQETKHHSRNCPRFMHDNVSTVLYLDVVGVAAETLPGQSMRVSTPGCQKQQTWGQKSQSYGYWYKVITSVTTWYTRASKSATEKQISNWLSHVVATRFSASNPKIWELLVP